MKKIIKLILLFLMLTVFFSGCEDGTPIDIEEEQIVISAFLYADQPVENIRITSTLLLGSTDTIAPPVSGAIVKLIKNEESFQLTEDFSKSGSYSYLGSDLTVESDDYFGLEVVKNELYATAETIVPQKPIITYMSAAELIIPEFSFNGSPGNRPNFDSVRIDIFWQNSDESFYYVVVENINSEATPIDLGFGRKPMRFISAPEISDNYIISMLNVSHYGEHRAIVYKVNQEYSDLYESREQDSRNLNEPLSNINNGLGVFSAFASDTVFFNVVAK